MIKVKCKIANNSVYTVQPSYQVTHTCLEHDNQDATKIIFKLSLYQLAMSSSLGTHTIMHYNQIHTRYSYAHLLMKNYKHK